FTVLAFTSLVQAGTIVVSTSTLPTFGNCPINFASDPQRYTVSGTGLSQNIILTAPEHFEISTTYGYGFAAKLTLNHTSGTVSTTTIYVRFSPYTSGSKSGNILHESAGSTTQNKTVLGNATATPATGTNAATYYSTISTTTSGATLKTALYSKILGHTVTAYGSGSSGLWATYSTTDPTYNGKVWDIYSTKLVGPSPFEFTFSTNQCGNYSAEGDCYNREHSFPQSWFTSSSPMVSDMFHIYPTDGKVNGIRNNYPHGEVSSATYTSLQGGKLGANTTSGYTGIVFEPIDDYKGDLARSFFYMATRYDNLIAGWQSNGNANDVLAGNTYPAYDAWFLNLLVKWHNQDPPSVKEINRNNAIYGYQNNRNPYIDSPQYVNKVWGGATSIEPTLASSNFYVKSNTLTTALISWKNGNGQKRLVIARAGSPVNSTPIDFQNYLASGVFGSGSQIGSGNFVVYNGMGSSIEISGLNQNIVYHFMVVDYNGIGPTANYLTSSTLASGAVNIPVDWLSFEAKQIALNQIQLDWATASETNNQHFEIERNLGDGYETIGKILAKGNSQVINRYQFMDETFYKNSLLSNVIWFRLKQVDRNGESSYSQEVMVEISELQNAEIGVVNPVEGNLVLTCKTPGMEAEIILTDIQGKQKLKTKTILNYETVIPFQTELSSGMYILYVVQRSRQQSFKIIKP
ncbi:MAG: endonuclease, partial [Bacteroidia bacterium]|nr:endonuclease [Bacteroidia bacterium]